VLGVVQGVGGQRRHPARCRRQAADRRALFESAARVLCGHAPDGLELDQLSVLAPIPTLKLRIKPKGFGRRLVGALCLYPNGSQIVELSTKAQPSEAFQVAAEVRAFLTSIGVDLEGKQETKTKTALEFFTRAMQVA
jgi:hypothetical protein